MHYLSNKLLSELQLTRVNALLHRDCAFYYSFLVLLVVIHYVRATVRI